MRLSAFLLCLVMVCPGCAQGPAVAPGPSAAGVAPVPAGLEGLERAVHDGVNAHRQAQGLSPLAYDARIAALAREHSAAVAQGKRAFGHDGFDARADRIRRFLPLVGMAENVYYDTRADSAGRAVQGWRKSPGHRENMEGDYDTTGVGVARAPGGAYYYTQIFVDRR